MSDELQCRMQTLLADAKKTVRLSDPIKDINLFSILGMENKEVSAHSAFLYYVLKPFVQKDGKVNDHHLRMFLKTLPLNIPEPDFVNIYREYPTDFGRLDFLILNGKAGKRDAVVIELKIWAGEQPKQIERYRDFLKQKGYSPENILFLTPDNRKAETGNATNITLKDNIKPFLQQLYLDYHKTYSNYAEILKQYTNLIDKLTGDDFMSEGTELFNSAMDIIAADKLFNAKYKMLSSLIVDFLVELQNHLVKDGKLEVDQSYPEASFIADIDQFDAQYIADYYIKGRKSYPALCFYINDKKGRKKEFFPDDSINTDLYFLVEIEGNLYAGITPRKRMNNTLEHVQITDKQKNALNEKDIQSGDVYLNWQHVQCDGMNKISFKDYHNGLLNLLYEDKIVFDEEKIKSIAANIKGIYKKQCEIFFEGIG